MADGLLDRAGVLLELVACCALFKRAHYPPSPLDYSIANAPSTVHDLLLQKSSGVFELVVWGEQVAGANNITVNLGHAHANVSIYDTTVSTIPIQILTDVTSVPLTVSDHALIVEIQSWEQKNPNPLQLATLPDGEMGIRIRLPRREWGRRERVGGATAGD
jgi:hypothetical protein